MNHDLLLLKRNTSLKGIGVNKIDLNISIRVQVMVFVVLKDKRKTFMNTLLSMYT